MDMKPPCKLRGAYDTIFSILFRVRDTLRETGLDDQAEEFLKRAVVCRSHSELVRLAKEYVELDGESLA